MPQIIIIAGPNGAGKTTFVKQYLPMDGFDAFVNADLIASGLSPFAPEKEAVQAGKLMLRQIDKLVASQSDFIFETTLAGRGYARKIPQWQDMGYEIDLVFLSLPSVEFALDRVAARVRQGGHNIPADVVERRYFKGLHNLQHVYKPLVDRWTVYDNTTVHPTLLERKRDG